MVRVSVVGYTNVEINTDEPVEQIKSICGEPTICYTRYDGSQSGDTQSAFPAERYSRFYQKNYR